MAFTNKADLAWKSFFKLAKKNFWVNEFTSADKAKQI